MNVEIAMNAFVELGARWILWVLIALSIIGLAVIIERCVFFGTSRDSQERLRALLAQLLPAGRITELNKSLSQSPSFEARVAKAALESAGAGADQYMLSEAEAVRLEMERHLAFLGTVGNNAPFIGLLGTVIGIIGAFRELDKSQGAITSGLMSEVGEALIATAVGLLVALPAIAAFNIFRRVIQARMARVQAMRRLMLAHLADSPALRSTQVGAE